MVHNVANIQFHLNRSAYFCHANQNIFYMKPLIAWVEIPATDFGRAVKFYNALLNLRLQELDFSNEKMACFPGGEGAVSVAPGFNPSSDGLLVSFHVPDSMEQSLQRVVENNGNVVIPKTKIEADGRGYFSVFTDSEGNKVGLYSDF